MLNKTVMFMLITIFLSGIVVFSQNEISTDYGDQISSFEKRFKAIDESLGYLKKNNVDNNDIIKLYTEAGILFKDLKNTPEQFKDYNMALELLSQKLSVIEDKSAGKISFAGRTGFMYIVMAATGVCIVLFMMIYSIFMYLRRK